MYSTLTSKIRPLHALTSREGTRTKTVSSVEKRDDLTHAFPRG